MKDNREKHTNGFSHMGLMMVGCLIMMAVLWLGVGSGVEGSSFWPIILLCPLMHVFMMFKSGKNNGEEKNENKDGEET